MAEENSTFARPATFQTRACYQLSNHQFSRMQELPVISAIQEENSRVKKPSWLRVKLPIGESYKHVRGLVDTHKLHTICESGNCPN
ncbi:MAG: hypothetical protein ACKODS_03140, partial [Methylophilaceae bacterium]